MNKLRGVFRKPLDSISTQNYRSWLKSTKFGSKKLLKGLNMQRIELIGPHFGNVKLDG